MDDLTTPTAIQAAISALAGTGSGLLATAIRVARRFSSVEKKTEEVAGDLANARGRLYTVEISIQPLLEMLPVLRMLPQEQQTIRGIVTSVQQALGTQLTKLEALKERLDEYDQRTRETKTSVNQKVKDMQAGFKLELVTLKSQLEEKVEEDLERMRRGSLSPTSIEELERRINTLERILEKIRDDSQLFVRAEAFTKFVEEQGRQWSEMHRALGRLEGMIKSHSSPSIPSVPRIPPRGIGSK